MRVNCAGKDWVIIFCRSRIVPREWAARALCAREYIVYMTCIKVHLPRVIDASAWWVWFALFCSDPGNYCTLLMQFYSRLWIFTVREPSAFLWRIAQIKCVWVCDAVQWQLLRPARAMNWDVARWFGARFIGLWGSQSQYVCLCLHFQ